MQWFRLYAEFATDPKVQMMEEAMQRRLVMLFCLQCSGEFETLSHEEVAFALRITSETLHETFRVFQQRGFIDEKHLLKNWDKRQFKSDVSTDRVRKYREKTKSTQNETFQKQDETVSVTAPEQNRAEQKNIYEQLFPAFWSAYPKRKGANPKDKAKEKFIAACIKEGSAEKIMAGAKAYAKQAKADGIIKGPYVAQAVTWLNQKRWNDEYGEPKGGGNAGYIGM